MKKIITKSYEEMSAVAAAVIAEQIWKKPDSVLGLATGSTPIGMYDRLSTMVKTGELSFSAARAFNLDEYYPIKRDNPQSYYAFMNEQLFSNVDFVRERTHIPNGEASDPVLECAEYEILLNKYGPIDVQVLGCGLNGHIGFNEPEDSLDTLTHVTGLTQNTISANARFFDDISEVPDKALTMGMGAIFKARHILLLISGENKAPVVKKLLEGRVSSLCPVTLLQLHSNVTLIATEDTLAD